MVYAEQGTPRAEGTRVKALGQLQGHWGSCAGAISELARDPEGPGETSAVCCVTRYAPENAHQRVEETPAECGVRLGCEGFTERQRSLCQSAAWTVSR